ncbi:carbamate kinase [Vagococcus sp.]|uniref:carbamate kinase n=1 Tax=Vagococcus sp. TaxID=1933889 RepID=UPI003F98B467
MSKLVIALGGNALGKTVSEQKQATNLVAPILVDLIEQGHEIIITHGNGPQVGLINHAFTDFIEETGIIDEMPFSECNAMSEGYIGYHIQNSIKNELEKRKLSKTVCTCVTQILVDKDDPAFSKPTKPIGVFYDKKRAMELKETKGYQMKEDSGRGYRRVVASPIPIDILEKEAILALFSAGQIVIACGGGGIPVVKEENTYYGVDAVIDKDYSSEKLAELVSADIFIILTAVDQVFINYGTEEEKGLDKITKNEVERLIAEEQFGEGSMLPKIQASLDFVTHASNKKAIITSIEQINNALSGRGGTVIIGNEVG